MDCGTLLVPLDYTNTSSNATLELQLARIPALSRPSRGSIQFNFGGPGEPGRPLLAQFAPVLRNLTAGEYDLIAFDPRGTGSTLPFRCAETDLEAQYLLLGLGQTANSSDTALGKVWAQAAVVSETCAESQNETGALIGTAFGARDLMQVVDALGEDGMLRYWGLSYGTTLGATVAAMFPDRIDKVILDGVQNPHEYYHAPASFDMTEQADGVFSAVFSTCVEAGPEKCPLAAKNMTAPQLESAVWDLLENQLKPRPLVLGTTMLDYSTAKGLIVKILYDNSGWPTLATIMGLLLADEINEVLLTQFFDALDQSNQTVLQQWQINTGLYGIHCGDRTSRTDDLNEWLETYEILTDGSRILGDYIAAQEMICAQWKIDAKEKYEGNFTATTENPMLIITNSGDPVTPMTSAHNVSSGFEGSVVLEVDGYGVSTRLTGRRGSQMADLSDVARLN
jgi:pimeloyl-ACP methyl ester carboxylesterase